MQWRVFERGRGRCGMLHQRTARPRAPARAASRVKTPFKPVGTGPTDPRHKQSLKLRLDIWAPHQPSADYSGAPSVSLPENVIPSADASMRLFPESYGAIARFMGLRVSGAVAPSAPARGRSLPQQCNL